MNIPGAFVAVDVNHDNVTETALLLAAKSAKATVQYGPIPKAASTPTGLVGATTYTATVVVNAYPGAAGTTVAVSILGSTAQTFGDLITQLNADLGVNATAALVGGDIVITTASSGKLSTISVTDSGANKLFVSVKGSNFGLQGIVTEKGNDTYLKWDDMDPTSQENVAVVMNYADPADTEWAAAVDGVDIDPPIAPATTVVAGAATGLTVTTTYSLDVTIDAVLKQLTFLGKPTFQQLVDDAITPALVAAGVNATASFVEGAVGTILLTHNVPGATPTLVVGDGTAGGASPLVAALVAGSYAASVAPSAIAAVGVDGVAGTGVPNGLLAARPVQPQARGTLFYATDTYQMFWSAGTMWVDVGTFAALPTFGEVLQVVPCPTGYGPLFTSMSDAVVETEHKPQAKGKSFNANAYQYHDGTIWRYYDTDLAV